MTSVTGDIRDYDALSSAFKKADPEIVLHLAAQPIVLESYKAPRYTYETNVMGTVNLLECIRNSENVRSVVNITTDKVYKNNEWVWGYRETDALDGFDPYSNSKSCSELVTHSYINSFFCENAPAVSTARAGNVIGGGDFAPERIVPDCVRAAVKKEPVFVRNPNSVRPFQHVLEPLFAYLLIAKAQYQDCTLAGNYNVGPDERDCITTGELVEIFCDCWSDGLSYIFKQKPGPHEANFLKLDCSKIKSTLGWKPVWDVREAIEKTVEWTKAYLNGSDMSAQTEKQIEDFIK